MKLLVLKLLVSGLLMAGYWTKCLMRLVLQQQVDCKLELAGYRLVEEEVADMVLQLVLVVEYKLAARLQLAVVLADKDRQCLQFELVDTQFVVGCRPVEVVGKQVVGPVVELVVVQAAVLVVVELEYCCNLERS